MEKKFNIFDLEFDLNKSKKEINYLELHYDFDSEYIDDRYRKYDGTPFIYKIDEENAKYDIVYDEVKREEMEINVLDVVAIMDNLYCWDELLNDENIIDWLKEQYINEAMHWFAEENYIEEEE